MVGITLYMQPLQDITIDSAVSRTQYQFVVESTDNNDFATWIPPLMQKLTELPELADVASDMEQQGTATDLVIDRCHRRAIRHHAGDRGQRALRFLRPAHRLDDLLAVEPIPRHSRGGSVDSALAWPGFRSSTCPHPPPSSNGQVPLSAIVQRQPARRALCRSRISDSFRRRPSPSISRPAPRSAPRSMPSARPSRTSAAGRNSSPRSRARRRRSSTC